jgi:hypothetical protein
LTEENCPRLYHPTGNGEGEPCAHAVRRVTRRQVYIEKTAEDGSMIDPDDDPDGCLVLCRRELERSGWAHHARVGTRFYRRKEDAR